MQQSYEQTRTWWLSKMSLAHVREAHWQLSPAVLVEEAIQKKEGVLSQEGALVCDTKQKKKQPITKAKIRPLS